MASTVWFDGYEYRINCCEGLGIVKLEDPALLAEEIRQFRNGCRHPASIWSPVSPESITLGRSSDPDSGSEEAALEAFVTQARRFKNLPQLGFGSDVVQQRVCCDIGERKEAGFHAMSQRA